MKIVKTNSGLGYNQYVHFLKLNDDELLIVCLDNIDSYNDKNVGDLILNEFMPYELKKSNLDIKESPLYGTFLFDYFLSNYAFIEDSMEEETIPITLGLIKNSCGWTRFCDVTNGNHYALKEWNTEDNEIFNVKKSHAKELGFI